MLLILILIVAAGSFFVYGQPNETVKSELVSYVNDAVALVQEKGDASFNEFYTSKWYQGDKYIFIWKLDGVRVVYPPDPKAVGQNMTSLKDYDGKPIGELFIEAAKNGNGWVEYRWPKPSQSWPSTKVTYIKKAQYQNNEYLVGSGIYLN